MNENFKMDYLDEEDELYHHGILGQKWGIRRTPEQLGHRTGEGRKGKGAKDSGRKGLFGRRKKSGGSDEAAKPKKKTISDMSDDELRAHLNRLQMTKNAMDLERQIASMQPKGMKQQMMEKLVKDVLPSAAKKLGDKYVDQILKKAFPEAEDPLAKLKKEYDRKKTEYDIYNLDYMRAKSKYNKAKAEYDFNNLGKDGKDDKGNSGKDTKDDKGNSGKETGSNTTSTERRGAIGIRGMRWGVRQSGSDESDSSSSTSRGFGEAFANSMRDYTMSQAAASSATSAGMAAVNQMLLTSLRSLPIPESEEDD